jgi:outer membrane protein OmpA-like peptidoglycan-associated protein/Tol biopolymer transport system component
LKKIPFIFPFFLFLLTACVIKAQPRQPYHSSNKRAIQYFEEGLVNFQGRNDDQAIKYLKSAIEIDDRFFEPINMLGDVYQAKKQHALAIEYYKKAIAIDSVVFPRLFLNCAESEFQLQQYASAEQHLKSFLAAKKFVKNDEKKAETLLASASFSKEAVKNPVPFNPVNLGPEINTDSHEYHPCLTADGRTIIFTRIVPSKSKGIQEDFYYALKPEKDWLTAQNMGAPLNTEYNEGTPNLSADGRTLVFTICNSTDGFGSCDLYISVIKDGKWIKPVNFGETVNSKDWDSQPSLSADGKSLFFVSKRGGGKGGVDIWLSTREIGGYWKEPINLGDSINTPFDDEAPFIHPDGKTLYFTSKGHPGLGGFDLFVSRKHTNGEWGKPVNLGFPINTQTDERQMIVSADGKMVYYSTEKPDGFGGQDIYYFELNEKSRPNPVTYFRGIIINKETKQPIGAKFSLVDLKTNQTIINSESDASNGKFLVSLPTGGNYGFYAENQGYLFFNENIDLTKAKSDVSFEKTIELQPIKTGEKMVMNNVFFETGSSKLKDESFADLDKLVRFLKSNPTLKIEISGHTDNVGDAKQNITLSESRAKSVLDFLVLQNIETSRMVFKGYGSTLPIADNNNVEGRAKNRRTEVKIL